MTGNQRNWYPDNYRRDSYPLDNFIQQIMLQATGKLEIVEINFVSIQIIVSVYTNLDH